MHECVANFHFHKNDLFSLTEALQIPQVFKTKQRNVADGMKGLCMLLGRFAYPCRYSDMVPLFARLVLVLSMIQTMCWTTYMTHTDTEFSSGTQLYSTLSHW